MKNLAIITLSLILFPASLSSLFSITIPSSLSFLSSLPFPSSLSSLFSLLPEIQKDPIGQLSKLYCSMKHQKEYISCAVENKLEKGLNLYKDCVRKVKYLETLDEITDFYCNKMKPEEFAKAKACMAPGVATLIATHVTMFPTLLNCMFKVEIGKR